MTDENQDLKPGDHVWYETDCHVVEGEVMCHAAVVVDRPSECTGTVSVRLGPGYWLPVHGVDTHLTKSVRTASLSPREGDHD